MELKGGTLGPWPLQPPLSKLCECVCLLAWLLLPPLSSSDWSQFQFQAEVQTPTNCHRRLIEMPFAIATHLPSPYVCMGVCVCVFIGGLLRMPRTELNWTWPTVNWIEKLKCLLSLQYILMSFRWQNVVLVINFSVLPFIAQPSVVVVVVVVYSCLCSLCRRHLGCHMMILHQCARFRSDETLLYRKCYQRVQQQEDEELYHTTQCIHDHHLQWRRRRRRRS